MRKFKQFLDNLNPLVLEYITIAIALFIVIIILVVSIFPIILSLRFAKWQYLLLYLILIPIIGPIFIMVEDGKI